MGKRKKEKDAEAAEAAQRSDFGHEIWGLIFLSLGLLVLIALISHFTNNQSNILGYYFGTALATGLIYIFGSICAFFFPVMVGTIGWFRLRGELINFRLLFYGVGLTSEACLVLAVHHLPMLTLEPSFTAVSNNFGLFFVRLLKPVFGVYTFGPYFLAMLTLTVTVLAAFRIPPQRLIRLIGWVLATLTARMSVAWQEWIEQRSERVRAQVAAKRLAAESLAAQQPQGAKPEKTHKDTRQKKSTVHERPVTAAVEGAVYAEETKYLVQEQEATVATVVEKDITAVEDEAKMRLEQELAAFRAKRNEPIKIMTIETEEVDLDEESDLVDFPPVLSDDLGEEDEVSDEDGVTAQETKSRPLLPPKPYKIPDSGILPDPPPPASLVNKENIERNSMVLENTLMNFNVEGKVGFVSPGPVVTRYEIELAPGIKVSRVVSLHDDISMAVGGQRIRIEAPIPGKSAVGIELPNSERQIVHFKHILLSDAFRKSKAKLPVVIGTNISGAPYVTDVTKMPHVLIAGQTGSGKSVCINSVICSLLMTKKPEELRLIMIDPKKVELAFYEGIPHLLSSVVTESKEAVKALQWGVIEMERRYRMLAKVGARNIDSFNNRVDTGKLTAILPEEDNKLLPFIVIIVDELADLMMTASKDVEGLIQRIAQLARAVGIHLIVATQRPSVDIITGPIKANLTSRIGFRTIQSTDSRTILGHVGAEKLLGMGDMLFLRNGAPEIERFHGAFISEEDVEKIVENIRGQNVEIEKIESFSEFTDGISGGADDELLHGDRDEFFEDAAATIVGIGQGSTSLLQRRMKIGYARAGRLMDELERAGFVGPPDGSKAREVLVMPDELDERLARLR